MLEKSVACIICRKSGFVKCLCVLFTKFKIFFRKILLFAVVFARILEGMENSLDKKRQFAYN